MPSGATWNVACARQIHRHAFALHHRERDHYERREQEENDERARWLAVTDGLMAFGCADTAAGRRRFVERLDHRAVEEGRERAGVPVLSAEADARCSHLRRGWYWGSQAFAERAMKIGEKALKKERHSSYRSSRESRAHGEREARRILREGLTQAGLTIKELQELTGSDEKKVAMAVKIWEQTTMNMKWIADHLGMKSAANASQQVRRHRMLFPSA